MKLGNFINELLKDNETVIIPGFGAFFSEYKPAEISETEIKPPSKSISFSSSIRNNDGLLVDYVANAKNVSHFDALKIIEKERDNIVFLLDKEEEVILEGLGKLSSNQKNKVVFLPFQDKTQFVDTFGLEAISLDEVNKKQQEEIVTENEQVEELPDKAFTEEPVMVDTTNPQDSDTDILNNESNPESSEAPVDLKVEESVESESNSKEDPNVKENQESVLLASESEPEKKKKKAVWYWYLLILIPILVAGIFISKRGKEVKPTTAKSNNERIQPNSTENKQSQNQPVLNIDSFNATNEGVLNEDTVITDSTDENILSDSVPIEPIYYLVGGSFKDEENAMEYLQELKEKGFEPFYMGKRGNFYMVGVGKYTTEGQAVRAREVIWEKNPGAGLWVMKE